MSNQLGIQYPEGIKPIQQVDEEVKEAKAKEEVLELSEEVKFEPALIRLAIPETQSDANKDLELLQSMQPPVWEDIDNLERDLQ